MTRAPSCRAGGWDWRGQRDSDADHRQPASAAKSSLGCRRSGDEGVVHEEGANGTGPPRRTVRGWGRRTDVN
jgi:hypothetical protein